MLVRAVFVLAVTTKFASHIGGFGVKAFSICECNRSVPFRMVPWVGLAGGWLRNFNTPKPCSATVGLERSFQNTLNVKPLISPAAPEPFATGLQRHARTADLNP